MDIALKSMKTTQFLESFELKAMLTKQANEALEKDVLIGGLFTQASGV